MFGVDLVVLIVCEFDVGSLLLVECWCGVLMFGILIVWVNEVVCDCDGLCFGYVFMVELVDGG